MDSIALLGFLLTFLCPGLVPIVLSIVGLSRIRRSGDRGRGLAIAGLILNALLVVAMIAGGVLAVRSGAERDASGRVVDGGSVSVASLRTGDCVSERPSGLVRNVDVSPCRSPHWGQVVAAFDLREGSYPGDEETERLADDGCLDRIPPDVLTRVADEELGLYYFVPLRESWSSERTVNCLVFAKQGNLTQVLPTS
jgi:hypothetical protein